MKSPCIAIDVAKGSSYFQGFSEEGVGIGRARKIGHDLEGYDDLLDLGNTIQEQYSEVVYIFEATGIYHRSLQQFLEIQQQKYIILNPLEAAKIRKSSLRSTKTDKKDCESIAKAYFMRNYRYYEKQDKTYETLKTMNRHYNFLIDQLRVMKVNFRNYLDIVFPRFDELFDNPYQIVPIIILKKYSHPDILNKHKIETIAKYLTKNTTHRENYNLQQATKLKEYSNRTLSGCEKDSIEVDILKSLISLIGLKQGEIAKHLKRMKNTSKRNSLYLQLLTIPGIGENLAVRITAELGDLSRFSNKRQLVAYAGIDPIVYQSGKMTGDHLHITKKGNKNLRTLLYLAVSSNVRTGKQNSILDFYHKKRQQDKPLAYKVALIACANKLLRIIYSMHMSGELFHD